MITTPPKTRDIRRDSKRREEQNRLSSVCRSCGSQWSEAYDAVGDEPEPVLRTSCDPANIAVVPGVPEQMTGKADSKTSHELIGERASSAECEPQPDVGKASVKYGVAMSPDTQE